MVISLASQLSTHFYNACMTVRTKVCQMIKSWPVPAWYTKMNYSAWFTCMMVCGDTGFFSGTVTSSTPLVILLMKENRNPPAWNMQVVCRMLGLSPIPWNILLPRFLIAFAWVFRIPLGSPVVPDDQKMFEGSETCRIFIQLNIAS